MGFRSNSDIWDLRADRLELPEDASRFEFTTIHFGAVLGLAAAIDELLEMGMDEVWRHDLELADHLIRGAEGLGIEVVSPTSESERSAIVSLRMPSGLSSVEDPTGSVHARYSPPAIGMLRVSPHRQRHLADRLSSFSAV